MVHFVCWRIIQILIRTHFLLEHKSIINASNASSQIKLNYLIIAPFGNLFRPETYELVFQIGNGVDLYSRPAMGKLGNN